MNVVITGSTRGIGRGLATEFLRRGHPVMISGRDAATVAAVTRELREAFPGTAVHGQRCDVTAEGEVAVLWQEAARVFGTVDCWINNAGVNNPKQDIADLPLADVHRTLDTNLVGMINGSVTALRGMRTQGSGWIWNMEGFGSDGMIGLQQIPYGLSKYGLRYFTKALVNAVRGTGVKVGYLSPGIVTTEMAVPAKAQRGDFFEDNKKLLNILADHVETVTPWLVARILTAGRNGTAIRWMGLGRAAARFALSPFRRRRVIEEAMARLDGRARHDPGADNRRAQDGARSAQASRPRG
jgi:NAD(P)-dependent dehydrogenase (short-subunit alcohol dehydrogenase family)